MIRYIIGIVISLVAITFMRAVWGVLQKAMVDEVKSAMGDSQPKAGQAKEAGQQGTTLRKCVACGTYKPEAAMVRRGAGDTSRFFCDGNCAAKA